MDDVDLISLLPLGDLRAAISPRQPQTANITKTNCEEANRSSEEGVGHGF